MLDTQVNSEGKRLHDAARLAVVGDGDGHRHPLARRHCRWTEGPVGAGIILCRSQERP